MNEYYAVIRSTDHLAHYGVKGMKWGVRKAKAHGNNRALRRQYINAQKKLNKLDRQADVKVQKEQAKKHARRGAVALGLGLGAFGINVRNGLNLRKVASQITEEDYRKAIEDHLSTISGGKSARKKKVVGEGKGIKKVGEGLTAEYLGANSINAPSQYYQHPAFSENAGKLPSYTGGQSQKRSGLTSGEVIAGIGAASLGAAAYQAGRAIAAKRRTTEKGHAKAVAKRNEFKREMDKAFAGTIYQNNRQKNNKRKFRRG